MDVHNAENIHILFKTIKFFSSRHQCAKIVRLKKKKLLFLNVIFSVRIVDSASFFPIQPPNSSYAFALTVRNNNYCARHEEKNLKTGRGAKRYSNTTRSSFPTTLGRHTRCLPHLPAVGIPL